MTANHACSGQPASRICVCPRQTRKQAPRSIARSSAGRWTPRGQSRALRTAVHVIGHLVADAVVAGEAGVRPYVYVESVDDTLRRVGEQGGALVEPPYRGGDLRVATLRDPAGNGIGVWQRRSPDGMRGGRLAK